MGLRGPEDQVTAELKLALKLNRALASIGLGRHGPALVNCLEVQEEYVDDKAQYMTPAQVKKVVFRKLQAAYTLRLVTTAEEALEECRSAGLEKAKWKDYPAWLKERRKEEMGDYDLLSFLEKAQLKSASYFSDSTALVGVRALQGDSKGKGTFATEDIKAGNVLMVERRSFICHRTKHALISQSDITNPTVGESRASANEAGYMVESIIGDQSLIMVSDSLFPNAERESPFASEEERLRAIRGPMPAINVDDLIRRIMTNAFGDAEGKCDLFGASSLINHSCLPNVMALQVGQVSQKLACWL